MLLESDILIDILRKHPPTLQWFASLRRFPPISGVAALELAHGALDKQEHARIKQFLSSFPTHWPEPADLQAAYDNHAVTRLSHGIEVMDSITSAMAIRLGLPVATFNDRHFKAITGLTTIQPYTR